MCWDSASWMLCRGAAVRHRKSDLLPSQHSTAATVFQQQCSTMTSKLAHHGGAYGASTDGCWQ